MGLRSPYRAEVPNWVWGPHWGRWSRIGSGVLGSLYRVSGSLLGLGSPYRVEVPNGVGDPELGLGSPDRPPPPLPAQAQQLIHPRLYGQFRRRCAELERRGDGAWTEQLLFHGTTAPRGLAICLHGFRGEWEGGPEVGWCGRK